MFADDTRATSSTMSSQNMNTLISSFNKEIQYISTWFKSNKLSLNLTNTNYVIFRSWNRRVPINLEQLQIDGLKISRLQNFKFLGVIMNKFLNWNIHKTDICKSLARNVGLLSKLKFVLPKNVLHTIYNSIVLPSTILKLL